MTPPARSAVETNARSWAKSIVWRVIGVVIMGASTYAAAASLRDTWMITLVVTFGFNALRVVPYYVHERACNRVAWGRGQHPLASLLVMGPSKPHDKKVIDDRLQDLW